MKYLTLIPIIAFALIGTSCKTKTAKTNPYKNNPYYGPSSTGSSNTYSSTDSSVTYPSYTENTYTPPGTSSNSPTATPPPAPSYTQAYSTSTSTYTTPTTYGGGSHTVARGENLYRISLQHGTSVAALKSANGLGGDTIHPGQVLRIP